MNLLLIKKRYESLNFKMEAKFDRLIFSHHFLDPILNLYLTQQFNKEQKLQFHLA
jgi:hypothetical protein